MVGNATARSDSCTTESRRGVCLCASAIAAACLLTFSCAPPKSDTPSAADRLRAADSVVREWVDNGRIPGAVLLVSRAGDAVFEAAYGSARLYEYDAGQYGASAAGEERPTALRRLGEPVPMTTRTVFDLASVTKVMATTFAVMLLVEAGELDLEVPVSTYLTDFVDAEPAPGSAADANARRQITLRHLLTHRAGLSQWKPIYYHADDAEAAYARIRGLPLEWDVGTERHYSDLGFMLLGRVVEQVAGEPLGAFLARSLYEPLGLSATGFRSVPASEASANDRLTLSPREPRASGDIGGQLLAATSHGNPYEHRMVHDPDFGYRIDGDPEAWGGWRQHTLLGEVNDGNAFHAFGGEAGHAGLFSTAADLQVLLQLLLNGGEYGGHRYLDAGLVDEFLASAGDGQALGWQVPDYAPPGSFAHTGFTGTYVLGVPSQNVGVVLLTNRQNLGVDAAGRYPDVGELQRAVARAVLGS